MPPLPQLDNASGTPRIEMGGQALIEGVLMRSRTGYAAALRRDDGRIVVRQIPYATLASKHGVLKLPILRGAVALFEMMAIGTRTLRWSGEEFEAGLKRKKNGTAPGTEPAGASATTALPQSAAEAWGHTGFLLMILLSLTIVIAMIVVLPNVLTAFIGKIPFVHQWAQNQGTLGFAEENHPIVYNLISGGFRALILFLYVWVISFNKDIKRVFEYHGAEHKAVLALEDGGDVTVARAQAHDTLHPRCGTTFIAVVVLVSIVFFSLVAALLVAYIPGFPDMHIVVRKLITFGAHIVVLPFVAGVAFEIMKFSARHLDNPICAALLWPGFRFQRITTRRPDDSQVEVAIVSLFAALAIPPDMKAPKEYVVKGLQDDESAPGYVTRSSARTVG